MLTAILAVLVQTDPLSDCIAKTGSLKQYTYTRAIERQGQTGSDSGAVEGPIVTLKNALGTVYRKGKVEVLHTKAGGVMKLDGPPGDPDSSPHEVLIVFAKQLKEVTSSDAAAGRTFTGSLPEATAKKHALLIGEFRRATVTLRANAGSTLVKSELVAVTAVGGRELTYKATIELTEIGTARIEIPPDVAKALSP